MVRFSRGGRAVLCMGHPQVKWSLQLMTQNGGIPAQFQGNREGQRSLTTKSDGMGNVQHHRNVGWPTGREPQGHGVLVVVWGGESSLRGEGGQGDDMGKGEGCEMHTNLNLSICRQLES